MAHLDSRAQKRLPIKIFIGSGISEARTKFTVKRHGHQSI